MQLQGAQQTAINSDAGCRQAILHRQRGQAKRLPTLHYIQKDGGGMAGYVSIHVQRFTNLINRFFRAQ